MDEQPNQTDSSPTGAQKIVRYSRQAALATELPFTLAGAVVVGGFMGYFLDHWLHTGPWLMAIFGAIGFVGGTREVIRRLRMQPNGPADGNKPA